MSIYVSRRWTANKRAEAVDVLTGAFAADPAARWVYPDELQYRFNFPRLVEALAGNAFDHRTAFAAADGSGAALWLPPDVHPDDEAVASVIADSVSVAKRDEVFALMEAMDAHHPRQPHWYLPLIGVEPVRHGRGVGAELMRRALDACDRDGAAAYLEATSDGSRRLYERFGFETVGTIQVGSSPPLYPMLRQARSPRRG